MKTGNLSSRFVLPEKGGEKNYWFKLVRYEKNQRIEMFQQFQPHEYKQMIQNDQRYFNGVPWYKRQGFSEAIPLHNPEINK